MVLSIELWGQFIAFEPNGSFQLGLEPFSPSLTWSRDPDDSVIRQLMSMQLIKVNEMFVSYTLTVNKRTMAAKSQQYMHGRTLLILSKRAKAKLLVSVEKTSWV